MSTLTNVRLALPPGLLQAVEAAHLVPPRAYHAFAHVQDVLQRMEEVAAGPGWAHPREAVLAALFHDAVYDVGASDNEARSAELAAATLATWLPDAELDVARVRHLITLTGRHGKLAPEGLDADARHFLDCDMAILGSAPARFDAYDAAVAEEYRGHIPAIIYRFHRRRFLARLLAAERIFLSDFFHQRLDAAARANLRRVLGRAA